MIDLISAEFVPIEEILKGKIKGKIKIRGWLHHRRRLGKILFLLIRDGTGIIQCTLTKDKEFFEELDKLPVESTLEIEGEVRKDKRAPGGYEIKVEKAKVITKAEMDYPIAKKYHGPDFLLTHRHLWIRSEKMQKILIFRSEVFRVAREWLESHGYKEFHAPIFTASACEGGATLFPVKYFGDTVYLTQSWQLYAEAAIASLGKIYTIAPSFRAEKSRTRRHLTEYWHLEVEQPFCDLECIIKVIEELISYMCQELAKRKADILEYFGRDPKYFLKIKPPFKRITYTEAVKILQKDGIKIEWGEDLTWTHEKALTLKFEYPFFVTHYPKKAKAFYHKPDPKDPRVTLSVDLLAPEGYGEIIGGGERISDYQELLKRIKEEGLKPEDYKWYLELRKWGTVQHAGFGLGIERFIAWMLKLEHIRDAIAFPRLVRRKVYP